MNKESKLGLLFFAFLLASVGIAFWIEENPFKQKYYLSVLFPNVQGLHKGSLVKYEGFRFGEVQEFEVQQRGVVAKIKVLEPQVKIYKSDRFYVAPNSTIASEYEIFVRQGERPSEEIDRRKVIVGYAPPGLQEFMVEAGKRMEELSLVMADVQVLVKNLNNSVQKVQPMIDEMNAVAQKGLLVKISTNISEATERLNKILGENDERISSSMTNLNAVLLDLDAKLDAIPEKELRESVILTKENLENVKKITDSIKPEDVEALNKSIKNLSQILSKLQSSNPDDDVAELIKDNLRHMKRISGALEKTMKNKTLFRSMFSKIRIEEPE